MVENLSDLYDLSQDASQARMVEEVQARWDEGMGWDIEEDRIHLADCPACTDTFLILTQGIDTIYLDPDEAYRLYSNDHLTVRARAEEELRRKEANRLRQLKKLPTIP